MKRTGIFLFIALGAIFLFTASPAYAGSSSQSTSSCTSVKNSGFTNNVIKGGVANAFVSLRCSVEISLVSYEAPDPDYNASTAAQQAEFDHETEFLAAGTHFLSVRVPNCYYQVDLVV